MTKSLKAVEQWEIMMPRLIELNAAGKSSNQIAIALSAEFGFAVTRNAVMGKIHRHRMRQAPNTGQPPRQVGGRPKDKADKGALVNHGRYFKFAYGYKRPAPELAAKARGTPVFITDLAWHHCRWPIGEPREMRYCGVDRCEPLPYCEDHARRAYSGTSSSWRGYVARTRRSRHFTGIT